MKLIGIISLPSRPTGELSLALSTMTLKRLLPFIFLLSPGFVCAQDMIITQYGDTLNNKIIFSTKRYLFYVDSTYYGRYSVHGINKKRVENFQMNAFRVDRNTMMMNQRAQDVMGNSFMLQGGIQLGFLPFFADSGDPSTWKRFLADLRIGFSYNASVYLRMRPHSLVGIFVDDFHSSAFAEKLDIPEDNGTVQHLENVKSTISMFQVGPEFMIFLDSKKFKQFFILSGGLGFTRFNWSWRAGSNSREDYNASGVGLRVYVAKTWAVGKTLIVGPNFKFQVAGLADGYGFAGVVPRLNLGLTVLVH